MPDFNAWDFVLSLRGAMIMALVFLCIVALKLIISLVLLAYANYIGDAGLSSRPRAAAHAGAHHGAPPGSNAGRGVGGDAASGARGSGVSVGGGGSSAGGGGSVGSAAAATREAHGAGASSQGRPPPHRSGAHHRRPHGPDGHSHGHDHEHDDDDDDMVPEPGAAEDAMRTAPDDEEFHRMAGVARYTLTRNSIPL